MNSKIKEKINIVREKAKLDDYFDFVIASIGESGLTDVSDEFSVSKQYSEFMKECDGAVFGGIYFWSRKKINELQKRVEWIPGEKEQWIQIGVIGDSPMLIRKSDGMVYQFFTEPELKNPFFELGQFDDFLDNYVLGEKYLVLFSSAKEDDEWFQYMMEQWLGGVICKGLK